MEYRIIRKDAFCFAGISRRVPMQFTGINSAISELERSITKEQWAGLRRLQDTEPREIVNVSYDSDTGFMEERGFLTHMIGVLTEHDDIDSQFDKLQMPALTWAVFPNEGPFPETLQNTMASIYAVWLQSADYRLASSLSFSFTKMGEGSTAYSEIWIPVVPACAESEN